MKIDFLCRICLISAVVLLVGCGPKTSDSGTSESPPLQHDATPVAVQESVPGPSRPSQVTAESSAVPKGQNHIEGFDADVLQFTDQGSGFFPMAIVRSLNDSKTGKPFLENLERFGLLPGEKSQRNQEGLPVGIVTNVIKEEGTGRDIEMFGFNCAACHTSDLHYNGKIVRVDGGSGLFYVDALGDQIGDSLKATLANPREFLAFLQRYMHNAKFPQEQIAVVDQIATWQKDTPLGKLLDAHLKDGSDKLMDRMKGGQAAQKPLEKGNELMTRVAQLPQVASILSTVHDEEKAAVDTMLPDLAGVVSDVENLIFRLKFLKTRNWLSSDPAHRLDAGFGRADDFGTARVELFGDWNPKNMLPVNAPVSVPPLWNVRKVAWLHWNANTNSVIQRSIGEALGVGGTFESDGETSVAIVNQMKIEDQVQKLTPPVWPADVFGKPDEEKVKLGRDVYVKTCAKCHDPQDTDEKGLVIFRLSKIENVGTDSGDAQNFDRPVFKQDGSTVGFAESIKSLLDLIQAKAKSSMSSEEQALMDRLEIKQTPSKWRDTMSVTGGPVYPARPLEGIWATAPYLHNGSIPTLYHLLFPEERPKKFSVGQKDFDPEKVGFELDPQKISPQPDLKLFEFDCTFPGNLNTGHSGKEYGTELEPEKKLALIEYLKVHKDSWPTE